MIETPDWDALLPAQTKPDGFAGTTKAPPSVGTETERGQSLSIKEREAAGDNRRRCIECGLLTERGLCLAAHRGEIVATRSYAPMRDILRRCEGYKPLPCDPDQRYGWDRWPGLTNGNQAPESAPTNQELSPSEK